MGDPSVGHKGDHTTNTISQTNDTKPSSSVYTIKALYVQDTIKAPYVQGTAKTLGLLDTKATTSSTNTVATSCATSQICSASQILLNSLPCVSRWEQHYPRRL